MERRAFLSLFAVGALAPTGAHALSVQEIEHPLAPIDAAPGSLDWRLLGRASDFGALRFPDEIRALHGQDVRLTGFMFPIQPAKTHQRFLLGGYAWHCSTCAGRDLTQIVDVYTAAPLPFRAEPVVVAGRLALLEGADDKLFYRVDDARFAS